MKIMASCILGDGCDTLNMEPTRASGSLSDRFHVDGWKKIRKYVSIDHLPSKGVGGNPKAMLYVS